MVSGLPLYFVSGFWLLVYGSTAANGSLFSDGFVGDDRRDLQGLDDFFKAWKQDVSSPDSVAGHR